MKKVFALFMFTIATVAAHADMSKNDATCDTTTSSDACKTADQKDMNDDHMNHDHTK